MSQADGQDPTIVEPPESTPVSTPAPASVPAPTPEQVAIPEAEDQVVIRVDEARRRSLRRWAIGGAVVLAIAVLAMSLTATPLFHAKTIEVEGAHRMSERQVRRAAGVDAQTNVFSLDEEVVARRLERNPWIADAVVTTSLPSTVRISVTEREPVGVTRTDEGVELVADDGSILGGSTGGTLPEIRLPEPAIGQPVVAVPEPLLATAASAASAFGPTLRPLIGSIIVQGDGTLTLELRDGVTVAYGTSSDVIAKAEALRAILDYADAEGKDLASIDLRTPVAPTARFVGVPVTVQVPPGEHEEEGSGNHDRSPSPSSPTPSP